MASYYHAMRNTAQMLSRLPPIALLLVIVGMAVLEAHVVIIYTYINLLGTLAMVEDTQCGVDRADTGQAQPDTQTSALLTFQDTSTSAPSTPSVDADTASLPKPAFSATTPYQPLTSGSKATLDHLRAIGGRCARFRGLGLLVLCSTIPSQAGRATSATLGGGFLATIACTHLAHVAAAPFQMAWTHIVISKPTGQWFWQRMRWTKTPAIQFPTAIWALAPTAARILEDLLNARHLNWSSSPPNSHQEHLQRLHGKIVGFILLSICWFFVLPLIHIPANIVLVRCQAALLSEEEFPIVRLDRTVGLCGTATPLLRMRGARFDGRGGREWPRCTCVRQ